MVADKGLTGKMQDIREIDGYVAVELACPQMNVNSAINILSEHEEVGEMKKESELYRTSRVEMI
jgi:hypothetical protein